MNSNVTSYGKIKCLIEYKDGKTERLETSNKVVSSGRVNMIKSLANQIGGTFEFYVKQMTFGSGGTVGGTPRFVDDSRQGLFGPTIVTKGVIASIDPDFPTNVTFTSVVTFDEGVGQIINEMGLILANGELYSMATFGDISKTSSMQLTFNWDIRAV